MKYNTSIFDGYDHFNDRAHQLFCLNFYEMFARIQQHDTAVTVDNLREISYAWDDLYHNQDCDSPIEYLLLASLIFSSNGYSETIAPYTWELIEAMHQSDPMDLLRETDGIKSIVIPQAPIGKYRVDFLIITKIHEELHKVIIECDGHDYHDKTKEQATRDKKRDRQITSLGIPVLRFTGSDIYKRPMGCAEEISQYLANRITKSLDDADRIGGKSG